LLINSREPAHPSAGIRPRQPQGGVGQALFRVPDQAVGGPGGTGRLERPGLVHGPSVPRAPVER
jgi:hypothetical protein